MLSNLQQFNIGDKVVIIQDYESGFWNRQHAAHALSYPTHEKHTNDGKSGIFMGYNDDSKTGHHYRVRIEANRYDSSTTELQCYRIAHYNEYHRDLKLKDLLDG